MTSQEASAIYQKATTEFEKEINELLEINDIKELGSLIVRTLKAKESDSHHQSSGILLPDWLVGMVNGQAGGGNFKNNNGLLRESTTIQKFF